MTDDEEEGAPKRFYFDDLTDAGDEEPQPARTTDETQELAQLTSDPRPAELVDEEVLLYDLSPASAPSGREDRAEARQDRAEATQSEPEQEDEPAPVVFDDLAAAPAVSAASVAPVSAETLDHTQPPANDDEGSRRAIGGILVGVLAAAVLILGGVVLYNTSSNNDDNPIAAPPASTTTEPEQQPTTKRQQATGNQHHQPQRQEPGSTQPTTTEPEPQDVRAPLTVLNNTTITGLAGEAAQSFSESGWTVTSVDNYTGALPTTTVFYDSTDPTQRAAAETLARQFSAVADVQPRIPDLPSTGLTVVLAPDWHA